MTFEPVPLADLAREMLTECERDGQAARTVDDDHDAEGLRDLLRTRARGMQMRIRTARPDETVVVVRTDADVWHDHTATMRRKLAPPRRP